MRSQSSRATRIAGYVLVGLIVGAALAWVAFLGFSDSESETNLDGLSTNSSEVSTEPVIGSEVSKIAPEVGAEAPDFVLRDLAGNDVRLSDYRGETVLLNFWATWCGPCRLEMPAIEGRYQAFKEDDFNVLAINFDESEDAVREFRDELGLSFPLLLDPGGNVQHLYRIRGYPSTVFVDPEGVVSIVHIGILTEGQLDQYLLELGYSL